MLCPDCGRSDDVCDCLVAGPPRQEGHTMAATATSPGAPGSFQSGAAVSEWDWMDGPDGSAALATPAGTEWADDLLQFLRDFASASPVAAAAAPADQLGRNRPVARQAGDLGSGRHTPVATADPAPRPQTGSGPFSPSSAAAPGPAAFPAGDQVPSPAPAVAPLRMAPFLRAQQMDDEPELPVGEMDQAYKNPHLLAPRGQGK